MYHNRYTQAVSKIKAPEGAVEKMLKTAESFEKKEKVIHMKKWIKGAVAASLAVAVTAGAVIGFNLFGGKANSFVMTVNAAEITKDNPVSVGLGEGGMGTAPKGDGMEYYIDLPLSVKGEHIKSVTYSVDKDAIAVHCRKDNNPVIDGDVVSESIDTLFDQTHIADDMKALEATMKNEGQSVVETNSLEEKLLNSYVGKKYSSITLAYDNQNPDGCAIGIVGKSTVEPVPDDESLEAKAKQLDSIIGNTLYCTVTFDDGTALKQSIHIGTTVTNFGTAHSESFNQLTEEEKALKDYTDVFVTYSITE
ncbi:hypothetical protein SAMN02910436_01310 [Ruminococcaceae bacterium P7]|nr:hypothetical protein SAMN02910436_01310 [Ruminococcaceae bacterium P7]